MPVHHSAKIDVFMQLRVVSEWHWFLYPFPGLAQLAHHGGSVVIHARVLRSNMKCFLARIGAV